MYCTFYNLRERPFNLSPNPEYLYLSATHKMGMDHLEYGLDQGAAFILLTGEVGSGKTTLLRHMLDNLGDDYDVAQVLNTQVSAGELIRLILRDFGLDPVDDKDANLVMLQEFLIERYGAGKRCLVVVDEAQNLSREALEEVRMFSNLQTESEPLLQVVLAGQPELGEKLRRPELRQLAQRITVAGHLRALDVPETEEYILHRLSCAGGGDEKLFTPGAMRRIHRETGGVPRLINNLCDAVLLAGYADGKKVVSESEVRAVVRDQSRNDPLHDARPPARGRFFLGLLRLISFGWLGR